MKTKIELSVRSQELMKKYRSVCRYSDAALIPSSLNFEALLLELNEEAISFDKHLKKERKEAEFLLVLLRTELLRDLCSSMNENRNSTENDKKDPEMSQLKWALLTAAGVLVAACQGFDGIMTMLSVFSLSPFIILAAGLIFSFLSVVVFCSFDLVKVSNALGVKLHHSYKLLDAYLDQLQQIKALRRNIDDLLLTDLSRSELKQMEQLVCMLQKKFSSLMQASKQFDAVLHGRGIKICKKVVSCLSALLFFGTGFFAGQSTALFLAGLLLSSAIPPFWPVMICSTIVGLAGFAVYSCVEGPGLKKLVSNWFGLNEEKIEQLCDQLALTREEKKLAQLNKKIKSEIRLAKKIDDLEKGGLSPEKENKGAEPGRNAPLSFFLKPLKKEKDDPPPSKRLTQC